MVFAQMCVCAALDWLGTPSCHPTVRGPSSLGRSPPRTWCWGVAEARRSDWTWDLSSQKPVEAESGYPGAKAGAGEAIIG